VSDDMLRTLTLPLPTIYRLQAVYIDKAHVTKMKKIEAFPSPLDFAI